MRTLSCLLEVGERDGVSAVGLALIAVGVVQVLVNADAELDELGSDAVELRGSSSGSLDGLVDLGGGVRTSGVDTTLTEHGEEVDLRLELEGGGEVVMLVVDVGGGSARAVLVVLMSPESLLVIALEIRPDLLQSGDEVVHLRSVELGAAVAGPGTVVVLGPKAVDDPIVEIVGTRVATRSSADSSGPTISKQVRTHQDQIATVSMGWEGRKRNCNRRLGSEKSKSLQHAPLDKHEVVEGATERHQRKQCDHGEKNRLLHSGGQEGTALLVPRRQGRTSILPKMVDRRPPPETRKSIRNTSGIKFERD